jgi:hypothetical protein
VEIVSRPSPARSAAVYWRLRITNRTIATLPVLCNARTSSAYGFAPAQLPRNPVLTSSIPASLTVARRTVAPHTEHASPGLILGKNSEISELWRTLRRRSSHRDPLLRNGLPRLHDAVRVHITTRHERFGRLSGTVVRTPLGRVASLGLDGRLGLVALRRLDVSTEQT